MKKGKSIIAGLLLALTIPATVAGVTFTIQNPETVKDWFNGEEIVTTSDHNKQIAELKSELEVYKELLAQADNDKNKIQELESEILKHNETIQDLQNQLENAQNNELLISDLQEQIVNQETIIADLQNQLELAQSDKAYIAQLEQKISQLEERIAELENQLEDQTGEEEVTPTSASLFTFDGSSCTGYVGDNSLSEIIIPKSYSTVTSTETVVGAKVLNKADLVMSLYDFISVTFSDGQSNIQTYTSSEEIQSLENDFPNDCYLVSIDVLDMFHLSFLSGAYDMQILQFPININGQIFNDGTSAFEFIMLNHILNINFDGDCEIVKFINGNDYLVNSVSSIGSQCSGFTNFNGEIVLLNNITSINDFAFYKCFDLSSIILPSSITNIGEHAFCGTGLETVIIPEGVIYVGGGAFSSCVNLKNVIIGNTVQTLGTNVFRYCSSLTNITIPSSVLSIGNYAFESCKNLTSMTILATTPPTLVSTSAISTATTKIYIPSGTLNAYQSATKWSNFADLFEELPA